MLPSSDPDVNAIWRASDENASPEQHLRDYLARADNDPDVKVWLDELVASGVPVAEMIKAGAMRMWDTDGVAPVVPNEEWATQVQLAREALGHTATLGAVYEWALRRRWALEVRP